jgi:ribosomal protein S18 acetylase RimI-like enzyme
MGVRATRRYLEISSLADLQPAPSPACAAIVHRVQRCPAAFYRFLYAAVGEEYHWIDRLPWTDDEIRVHLAREAVQLWVMYVGGAPAGWYELRRETDGAVEIAYFGLLKEFHGQGLGGFLLTEATRQAFAQGATRVWLHTCTLDHPAALRNYLSRGFRVVREEDYMAQLRQ